MEVWKGLSCHDIMSLPFSRRRRLIQKKIDIERERNQKLSRK